MNTNLTAPGPSRRPQSTPVSASPHAGRRCVVRGVGCTLSAALTGCTGHDYVFGAGFMSGLCVGALVTAMICVLLNWSDL